jgi:pyruvate formate lyase activating enzyme
MQALKEEYSEIRLTGSGWKPVSMVDVYRSVTFTIWLCGCNLKCPFCHNWRIAEGRPEYCRPMDTDRLLDELSASRMLIDYVHVTGGEPLVQYRGLERLFKIVKENIGVKVSLNTNFTLHKPLELLLRKGLVDHLATDLKIPPHNPVRLPRRDSPHPMGAILEESTADSRLWYQARAEDPCDEGY